MATILVCQNSPLGVELYFYAKTVFCLSKLLPAACQVSGNALLEDEAACGLALISYYPLTVCALFIFIQILLQRMMKETTIQIDGISTFGGMHIWNICNLENTKLNTLSL